MIDFTGMSAEEARDIWMRQSDALGAFFSHMSTLGDADRVKYADAFTATELDSNFGITCYTDEVRNYRLRSLSTLIDAAYGIGCADVDVVVLSHLRAIIDRLESLGVD